MFAMVVGPVRTRWPSLDMRMSCSLVGPIGPEVDTAVGGTHGPRCSSTPIGGLTSDL
jgi:hypothetical protein